MAEMGVYTYDVDKPAYASEQIEILKDQAAFRTGNIAAGVYALGRRRAMYRLLWYRKHQRANKPSSDLFISLLKATEDKLLQYARTHKNDQPSDTIFKAGFRELVADFDLVEDRYQQVILECEVAKP